MIALLALMFAGCLCLWIGVPLAWLWIGSQIQVSTSLGTALAVSMIGSISSIILIAWGLLWLDRRYAELRLARMAKSGGPEAETGDEEEEEASGALEPMVVASAAIALVGFGIWFFFFAGTSPIPLNPGN